MVKTQRSVPLPGLELTPDVMFSTDAAQIQARRQKAGDDLASWLADGTIELVEIDGLCLNCPTRIRAGFVHTPAEPGRS